MNSWCHLFFQMYVRKGDTRMTTFQTATRYFLSETFVVVNVYWVKLYSVHHTVVWLVAWWNYDAAISFFSFLQMMLCSSPCFVFTSDKLIKDSFFLQMTLLLSLMLLPFLLLCILHIFKVQCFVCVKNYMQHNVCVVSQWILPFHCFFSNNMSFVWIS